MFVQAVTYLVGRYSLQLGKLTTGHHLGGVDYRLVRQTGGQSQTDSWSDRQWVRQAVGQSQSDSGSESVRQWVRQTVGRSDREWVKPLDRQLVPHRGVLSNGQIIIKMILA